MAVKFGVFTPQGWRMDLVQIKDPIEKYEAMPRSGSASAPTPCRHRLYIPGVAYDQEPLHRFETEVIPQVAQPTPIHSTKE
jgi:hypothetical protein